MIEYENTRLYQVGDPELLRVGSESTLARWRSQGHGPAYYKIRGRVAYLGADLNRFVAAQRVEPRAHPMRSHRAVVGAGATA